LKRDYGIELITPNRKNRSQTQDGRKLRRYKRRWCVELLFAWLQWSGDWSRATNITSRTFSAWSASAA